MIIPGLNGHYIIETFKKVICFYTYQLKVQNQSMAKKRYITIAEKTLFSSLLVEKGQ